MAMARVSSKGQITLPAAARRKYGIEPNSRVEIITDERGILVRPARSISGVAGILAKYAKGVTADWETVRAETELAVARQVADE